MPARERAGDREEGIQEEGRQYGGEKESMGVGRRKETGGRGRRRREGGKKRGREGEREGRKGGQGGTKGVKSSIFCFLKINTHMYGECDTTHKNALDSLTGPPERMCTR